MMMKNIFLLLFVLSSFACLAQPGSLSQSVYRTRVNDSTSAKSANTSPHSNGYADLWWNNQASPAQWMFWNGSNYERFSSFTTGLPYWPLAGNFSTGGSQTITLGGGMNIDAGTFSFQLGGVFDGTQLIYDDANSLITINSQSMGFEINGAAGYIAFDDNANSQGFILGNGAGIEYNGDYSGSFSARTLIDKGYADTKWSLATGGTLTGNNSILGAGTNDLNLGTSGSRLDSYNVNADNTSTFDVTSGTNIAQHILATTGSVTTNAQSASGTTQLVIAPTAVTWRSDDNVQRPSAGTNHLVQSRLWTNQQVNNSAGGTPLAIDVDINIMSVNDAIADIIIRAVAIKSDGSEGYSSRKAYSFLKDGAANPTALGSETVIFENETDVNANAVLTVSGANIRLTVTTPANDDYRWVVWAEITHGTYN